MNRLAAALFPFLPALSIVACEGEPERAPPARTTRLVPGALQMVGDGTTTCSRGAEAPGGAPDDLFCAFARTTDAPGPNAGELWVVNVTRALAAPVACDGSNPHCVRITGTLWTGDPIFSLGHPYVHGFDGDTLVFYADSTTTKNDEPYEGPVKAWRPGWTEARALTSPRGVFCAGHPRAAVAICIDDYVSDQNKELFDVLAGPLPPGARGPLPRVERVNPRGKNDAIMWHAAFSPTGEHFGLSLPAADGQTEVLRVARTADLGTGTAFSAPLPDATRWQIANDGQKIYYLSGFTHGSPDGEAGTLAMADFPSLANSTTLQPGVGRFMLLGEVGGPDQGVGFLQDVVLGVGSFRIARDRTRPMDVVTVEPSADEDHGILVSGDLRYSFFNKLDSQGEPGGFIAANDGRGQCQLNAKPGFQPYLPTFLAQPRVVLWGEDSEDDPTAIEGWLGDPEGCMGKQRFSANLAYLDAVRDVVVHGEAEKGQETMTLGYAKLTQAKWPAEAVPVRAGVDPGVTIAAGRYLVFAVSRGPEDTNGLYVHGPLP